MPVLLIPNPMKDPQLAVARQAAALLREYDAEPLACEEFAAGLDGCGVTFLPKEQAFQAAGQVLTIGGDGTLLAAAEDCLAHRKPVLGVNLGRTGFLATCEPGELPEKLARLAGGAYTLEPRSPLHASCPQNGWQAVAVNDVVLYGKSRLHPLDYTVYCDGMPVCRYRSDGIIAATPTGSTAYSLSAGGPIIDAAAPVVLITPICAHSIHAAPLVFSGCRRLKIVAEQENRYEVCACADSRAQCALRPGDAVELAVGKRPLELINFGEAEQFRAIQNKLMRR